MIRRDATGSDGAAFWILIDQTQHARLAADIARSWGAAPLHPLVEPEILLPAIERHDDGWQPWDAQPQIDPRGCPIAFNEMEVSEAQEIWSRSVAGVADLGPLAQYVVAAHFLQLRKTSTAATTAAGSGFIRAYDARTRQWRQAWQDAAPQDNTPEIAEMALNFLQLCDVVSLWLGCADRTATGTFRTPGGPEIAFVPLAGRQILVRPWPWRTTSLTVRVHGRRVPVRPYADRQALAAAPTDGVSLEWQLLPERR